MKILTWNINGIRAIKPSFREVVDKLDADIICLQETKVTRDQLDEPIAILEGYNSYFSFSKVRSGYSGVATYVRDSCTPVKAEEGLTGHLTPEGSPAVGNYGDQKGFSDEELHALDAEGRTIITQHRIMDSEGSVHLLTIINVYCPRADHENEERQDFKVNFYRLLQIRAESILRQGSHVIVLGDVNTSHRKLDHCDPVEEAEFNAHRGRQWLNQFIYNPENPLEIPEKDADESGTSDPDVSFNSSSETGHKFVDSFRRFHPTQQNAYTCWSTVTGSRAVNYGVRIDYILGDVDLVEKSFTECLLLTEVEGSDHCPVKAWTNCEVIPAKKCPPLCTKYLPEFAGKQQKLSSFFMKKPSARHSDDSPLSSSQGSDSSEPPKTQNTGNSEKPSEVPAAANATVKRQNSDSLPKPASKKLKKDGTSNSKQQGSLLSFFSKPSQKNSVSTSTAAATTTTSASTAQSDPISTGIKTPSVCETSVVTKQSSTVANSWKTLLKGPPPPPICKGHQEACLLRTVKKDSLNKGRQFWVCPRPEGHKTNPEARCDTFIWLDKKKKA